VVVQDGQEVDYLLEVLLTRVVAVVDKVGGLDKAQLVLVQLHNQHLLQVGTDSGEVLQQQEEAVAVAVLVVLVVTPLVPSQATAETDTY